ncbi:hypothetical protein [Lacipirellula parvula]|uniref:Uncharacterized protein n=1 Tax=Lacipirellula parvula TaxID=2650471 RepID=A0A5K7XBB6_9BACT|nr:hypothetical protein [Lacipirellula parvula]BBO33232.1 hypothetical protein PLANPX_2844 [Lacipirellula parvula]
MLTYFRYALATICFMLSMACLGLWGASYATKPALDVVMPSWDRSLSLTAIKGMCYLERVRIGGKSAIAADLNLSISRERLGFVDAFVRNGDLSSIGGDVDQIRFPTWYPALVFALAGVGALRLGRRFTLRSAIIATTVVAGLLGMVVAL